MSVPMPVRAYQGVPTTSEADLYTAPCLTVIDTIHAAGDGTGGTVSLSVVPSGGSEATANRIAIAFAVAANSSEDILPTGKYVVLEEGDFISGLQSSGEHVTLTICGHAYADA